MSWITHIYVLFDTNLEVIQYATTELTNTIPSKCNLAHDFPSKQHDPDLEHLPENIYNQRHEIPPELLCEK